MHRILLILALVIPAGALAQGTPADYERSAQLASQFRDKVFRDRVEPRWFADGSRFWYRVDLSDRAREFIEVNADAGTRAPAFDHRKLAAALARAAGKDVKPTNLPFDHIAVDGNTIRFPAFEKGWAFDRGTGTLVEGPKPPAPPKETTNPRRRGQFGDRPRPPRVDSPYEVTVRDGNLYLRKGKDKEFQLTRDGTPDDGYGREVYWSPDFSRVVALRTRKGEERKVHIVASSPRDQLQPKLTTLTYAKPGDRLSVAKPHLFDVAARKEIPIADDLFPNPWGITRMRWDADGKAFTFVYNQRGHQVLRVIEVNAETGKARAVINEESKTFIDYAHKQYLAPVTKANELVWMSERDGWNHLYLYDRKSGTVKNQITKGEWVVRGVDRVDEDTRQIWFQASGLFPDQDPYYVHFCRINFDGTGLVRLTEADGTHSIQLSPNRKYYLDTYSRVDLAPVTELRRSEDGKLVATLETGDMSALLATRWKVPEKFVAKGRDGTTDIHGVIYRPTNFDASKKYPVIEQIYAGPQGSFVPKGFRSFHFPQEIAELGFITVQIDGMGTSNRSKAFHDVCCKNLGDAGFPDRILWMKAAARKYPYLDLSRVGVYGGSAGGQNALGAMLRHGDFYKAAAADCGCHDNRMDKVWWNELWMGYPVGPHYAEQSNVTQAHKLTGKLLLTVGELDTNVDPASTMQVVNALIRAGKDFELIVFPNGGHGAGGTTYGLRRRKDFFVKHLLGVQPPDRNSPPPTEAPKAVAGAKKDSPEPRKATERKGANVPPPPDLAALIAQPTSEVRVAARHYDADRGALRRKYTIPTAPAQFDRLRRFHQGWATALQKLDRSVLSASGRDDLATLAKRIERDLADLHAAFFRQREIESLLPFGPAIVRLEEDRWQLTPFDPVQLAGRLTELRKQMEMIRERVAADLAKADTTCGMVVTRQRAEWAAEGATSLRGVLKSWYSFYAEYDPLFTWWVSQPYKEADAALDAYAKLLKDRAPSRPAEDRTASALPYPRIVDSSPANLPDVPGLLKKPSELMAVIQRYQVDFGFRGRRAGPNNPASDRQARQRDQLEGWRSALEKLDFDALSPDARVDYILLQSVISRDLKRLQQPNTGGGRPRAKDSNEIVGRPIGREALLAALAAEMIPYSPEQLVELANREYAWCEAEMKKASREMGFGDDWHKALEKVKTLHVPPGGQPKVVRDMALEAIDYLRQHDLVTVPPLAAETWRMGMLSPERQKFSPFFLGGEVILVSFPTDTMSHEAKLQSLRGNNVHFSRATVHHELIPGHHLQQFMVARHQPQRGMFGTPFWTEGWAVYWEMVLYERGFPRGPEDRVGLMFWRMHRCARVIFSLGFHLGKMTPQECIDFLVDKVGHERDNATAEVRRSFAGGYPPLYQAGYLVGAKQFWALRKELVETGRMTDRAFHDAILKENHMPVEMVRAVLTNQPLTRDYKPGWKFAGDLPAAEWPKR
jgi:dipeptidyl aminopeptidase/acylaminoacyl peptidase